MKACFIIASLLAIASTNLAWARTLAETDSAEVALDGRIVGGYTVDITAHPHQVSMRLKDVLTPEESYSHNCGGSIYSTYLVVTAAHCVMGNVASEYQIVAGANEKRSVNGVVVPVKEFIIHEQYNPNIYNNDIALVVLGAPLPINNVTIKAIPLADKPSANGAISVITGWGSLIEGGTSPDLLQEVKVPIVSNEICQQDYLDFVISDAMLCAGVRGVGGKDACQGDSGGPLVVDGKLAGVVSWGLGCARANAPGVYANVTHLRSWLDEKIAEVESTLLY
ncbi:PREDICTED: trypsin zeta-like [Bactrocera latifrons]|uniref:trypsin zeta-like n=1 Tax=Bactrocera latifrons TaxID=174628 RepID=UPI0008DCC179|nr:PREDICTED: trypsin zeta-like [Bactrocera latifrons]